MMAYCWDDENSNKPHPTPYTYDKDGIRHAACDRCGWHSYGLPYLKRRIVQRWADGHVCPEPSHTYRPGPHGLCNSCAEPEGICVGKRPLQYGEEKGARQEAAPWPPGRSADVEEGS